MHTASGKITRVISSDTISYLYYKAALLCKNYSDRQYCNQLLHLCALRLYDQGAEMCRFFQTEVATNSIPSFSSFYDANWKQGLPWLSYSGSTNALLSNPAKLSFKVTLGADTASAVHTLPFFVARWAFDGSYLGFEALTTQLSLCPSSRDVVAETVQFGSNIRYSCNLDLRTLLTADQEFFSLWIRDQDGSMVAVPIAIRNQRD